MSQINELLLFRLRVDISLFYRSLSLSGRMFAKEMDSTKRSLNVKLVRSIIKNIAYKVDKYDIIEHSLISNNS